MKNTIQNFNTKKFYDASVELFKKLSIPLDTITELSIVPSDIFETPKPFFDKIKDIYTLGMISDKVFDGQKSEFNPKNKKDYEAVLIFAVELNEPKPTRSLLSDIARAFNREYHYTPVIVLFKYDDKLSLANTQRQNYKINKEGEKAGKVTILRDINITTPHTGHIKILNDMRIPSKIKTYDELYKHWQDVFDVSILNKAFYKELQNWYFYAINEVVYPNEPKLTDSDFNIDKLKEYRAKNVIRLLTRLLFVWFIKEKGLIPNELFEEHEIKKLIKSFEPRKQDKETLFGGHDKESRYYKAILQNLFFATLNQEMKQRAFRIDGRNQNTTNLMRYKKYFENPDDFISLVESVVPFMNGGLFECLDAPHPIKKGRQGGDIIVYEDGFSDRDDNPLIVPDYIFFGHEDHIDLSVEYGSKNKAFKDASVKGLINILKSYKFTIAENTPIEEDVALDPELLGKVFENLLASYNPETKTTARKQTGSFYTPREIVNYMVDESLIAYLKTKLGDEVTDKDELDKKLHELLAYDDNNPFSNDDELTKKIIDAIDEVKILDPAVGSGAFPMGALQKMVHLLSKLDPENKYWQDLQLKKAQDKTNDAFKSNDKNSIKEKVDEIFDSFDETINNPDYARKLYLIENTIFGVDIQPIAIQISKLRFFISLVVEQNINNDKENFGIRPLPNLESKFVAANTLIGLEKKQQNLFDRNDIKELENELQDVRHKIFNAKTPKTKRKYRELDKHLRDKIKQALLESGVGNNTAEQLSSWDPYNQNSSSPFFDMEWMFGIKDGFDIVIGNPPYFNVETFGANSHKTKQLQDNYPEIWQDKSDILFYFIARAIKVSKSRVTFITSNAFLHSAKGLKLRNFIVNNAPIDKIINFEKYMVFESASITSTVVQFDKNKNNSVCRATIFKESNISKEDFLSTEIFEKNSFNVELKQDSVFALSSQNISHIIDKIDSDYRKLKDLFKVGAGMQTAANKVFLYKNYPKDFESKYIKKRITGDHIEKYHIRTSKEYLLYIEDTKDFNFLPLNIQRHLLNNKTFLEERAQIKRSKTSKWWKYTFPMHKDYYHLDKIWCSYRGKSNIFCLDDTNEYIGLTNMTVIFDSNNNLDLKYILSLLNSRLLEFRHKKLAKQTGGGIYEYVPNAVEKAPIIEISQPEQKPFIDIVNKIMEKKQNEEDTTELENQIDQMVYELYGLTEDEIKIVEGSVK